jgi:hypothetical protein
LRTRRLSSNRIWRPIGGALEIAEDIGASLDALSVEGVVNGGMDVEKTLRGSRGLGPSQIGLTP